MPLNKVDIDLSLKQNKKVRWAQGPLTKLEMKDLNHQTTWVIKNKKWVNIISFKHLIALDYMPYSYQVWKPYMHTCPISYFSCNLRLQKRPRI